MPASMFHCSVHTVAPRQAARPHNSSYQTRDGGIQSLDSVRQSGQASLVLYDQMKVYR
jgi:hypothetical protein